MKLPILIFFFIASVTAIYAQTPRIEAINRGEIHTYFYKKGGDSLRYTILEKKDTVQKTEYYRNGKTKLVSWKQDSSYTYDVLGRLMEKRSYFKDEDVLYLNGTSYFANGQIYENRTYRKGISVNWTYASDGRLRKKNTTIRTASGYFTRIEDGFGLPIQTFSEDSVLYKKDSVVRRQDTLYYASGKVFKIETTRDKASFGAQWYDKKGVLVKKTPPDTLDLVIFKDNVDCYYGLKTQRGDTIVRPRFDRIKQFDNHFFVAYVGESAILIDRKGAPMTPPCAHLKDVEKLNKQNYFSFTSKKNEEEVVDNERWTRIDTMPTYFYFKDDDKYGVMTNDLKIVVAPQNLLLLTNTLGNAELFDFREFRHDTTVRMGFLTREGKPLFGSRYRDVTYTNEKDYFKVNVDFDDKIFAGMLKNNITAQHFTNIPPNYKDNNSIGLGKFDETIVLPPIFFDIRPIFNTDLFITSLIKTNDAAKTGEMYNGIYNSRTKRWLLDSIGFHIKQDNSNLYHYFVIEQQSTKKWGIMDTTGSYVLPLAYDSIGYVSNSHDVFWVKSNGKYQIFEINKGKTHLHKTQYDFIFPQIFEIRRTVGWESVNYFLAQRKNKWGVIDVQENVLKPFEYDYAAVNNYANTGFYLVKNNQMSRFDVESLPNEQPYYEDRGNLRSLKLINNRERVFFVNDTGKVVIPPQYKYVSMSNANDYVLALDDQARKKVIFIKNGAVVDYPFDYNIETAHAQSRVIGVKDSMELGYGVVSTDGKLLVPCINYGVAIGDLETSTFFVKRDTPLVNRYIEAKNRLADYEIANKSVNPDTLYEEDNGWMMYDGQGKLVTSQPFRFPIDFSEGVGVGMQDNGFHLYKTDGTILQPFLPKKEQNEGKNAIYTEGSPQGYISIRRDPGYEFYALYKNQGMSPTMILTKANGEIVVKGGRYDGISQFYGKYALVTTRKNVGLIDTLGREVIAPQDLRTYSGHFMDSLKVDDINYENEMPFKFEDDAENLHPDSLKINTAQRAALWNLLLENSTVGTIATASDVQIPRTSFKANASFFSNESHGTLIAPKFPLQIVVSDKTIAFSLGEDKYRKAAGAVYFNYYLKNNRWEALQLNDLLQIQGDKRWKINDMLSKKIKALEEQQIDCSNTAAFITQVENKWLLTEKSIDFCFLSTEDRESFVVISFTWAELQPFLKLKIY
jgi:hypothetical protein